MKFILQFMFVLNMVQTLQPKTKELQKKIASGIKEMVSCNSKEC